MGPRYIRPMASARGFIVAAWNEHDPVKRRQLIGAACTEDVALRTPGRRIHGREQLDALIADFQTRRPEARAAFTSPIDIQGTIFRYTGIVEGTTATTLDTGECDDEGRIRVLLTFVGAELPAANVSYNAITSCVSTLIDQASPTMWCMVNNNMCSRSLSFNKLVRTSGPCSRSKDHCASCVLSSSTRSSL